jgi:hypothetical protein
MDRKRMTTALRVTIAASALALVGSGLAPAVAQAGAKPVSVGVGCSLVSCTENHNQVLL